MAVIEAYRGLDRVRTRNLLATTLSSQTRPYAMERLKPIVVLHTGDTSLITLEKEPLPTYLLKLRFLASY